jgi:hypothetical protein
MADLTEEQSVEVKGYMKAALRELNLAVVTVVLLVDQMGDSLAKHLGYSMVALTAAKLEI